MDKHAWIAKLLKHLSTAGSLVPGIDLPRTPEDRLRFEHGARGGIRHVLNDGPERLMRGAGVHKVMQLAQPALAPTGTPYQKATFGDRFVYNLAHEPAQKLIGGSTLPLVMGRPGSALAAVASSNANPIYNATMGALEKRMGIPAKPSFDEAHPEPPGFSDPRYPPAPVKAPKLAPAPRAPTPAPSPHLPAEPSILKAFPKHAAYTQGCDAALSKFLHQKA